MGECDSLRLLRNHLETFSLKPKTATERSSDSAVVYTPECFVKLSIEKLYQEITFAENLPEALVMGSSVRALRVNFGGRVCVRMKFAIAAAKALSASCVGILGFEEAVVVAKNARWVRSFFLRN